MSKTFGGTSLDWLPVIELICNHFNQYHLKIFFQSISYDIQNYLFLCELIKIDNKNKLTFYEQKLIKHDLRKIY